MSQQDDASRVAALRTQQVLVYWLAAMGTSRRLGWSGSDLARWLAAVRDETQLYQEYIRRWGLGNPWSYAAQYLRLISLAGGLVDYRVTGGAVEIRHRPVTQIAPNLARRLGAVEEDFRAVRLADADLLRERLELGIEWDFNEAVDTVRIRSLSGHPAHPEEWRPDPPELLPAVALRGALRNLGVLLGLGLTGDESPERIGRALARTMPAPASPAALQTLVHEQFLTLSDGVSGYGDAIQYAVEAEPVTGENWGLLQVYGVQPHHLGRFWNGLLGALADPLHVQLSAEVGFSLLRCTLRRR